MKKEYVKPAMTVVTLDCDEQLLESSYVNVGGKTDSFNTRERGDRHAMDDKPTEYGNLW